MKGIMLHCGGETATLKQVAAVPVPKATESWRPVPYVDVVERVEHQIPKVLGREVVDRQLGLGRGGQHFFGLWEVEADDREMGWSIAVRQSYDKSLALGVASGANVFVCDNLIFDGDAVRVVRKNTKHVWGDFRELLDGALWAAEDEFEQTRSMRETMKRRRIRTRRGYEILGRAVGEGVLRLQQASIAYREWDTPSHRAFRPRNLWSLYNDCTEALKKGQAGDTIDRHTTLTDFFRRLPDAR